MSRHQNQAHSETAKRIAGKLAEVFTLRVNPRLALMAA